MCGLVHLEENLGRKTLEIGPAGKKKEKKPATVYKSDDGVDEPEHMTADRVSRKGGAKGACVICSNGYRYVEAGWLRSRRSPGGGTLSRTVSVQLLNGRVDGDAARRRSGGCGRIGEQQKGWKILRVQKMMR